MQSVEAILGNPCSVCPGNSNLCSNSDSLLQFNSLTCQLISDWILLKEEAPIVKQQHKQLGRPIGSPNKVKRQRQSKLVPEGTICRYCKSDSNLGARGSRQNLTFSVRSIYCYSCSRRFSIRVK